MKNTKLNILHDIYNNVYLGIHVDYTLTDSQDISFLSCLKSFLNISNEMYTFNKNLLSRNKNTYHITCVSLMEINKFNFSDVQLPIEFNDIKFKGIGTITKNDLISYFVTVESESIQKFRRDLGLSEKDLHITLGFNVKDLHHTRKNISNILQFV